MKISDELLMAYADNELDAPQREAIEQAMQTDPSIAQAVARHQALRRDVFDAFAGVLDEPVPAKLTIREERSGGEQVHGEQPLVKRNVAALHHGAGANGELVAAIVAEEHPGLGLAAHALHTLRGAVRASDAMRPTALLDVLQRV